MDELYLEAKSNPDIYLKNKYESGTLYLQKKLNKKNILKSIFVSLSCINNNNNNTIIIIKFDDETKTLYKKTDIELLQIPIVKNIYGIIPIFKKGRIFLIKSEYFVKSFYINQKEYIEVAPVNLTKYISRTEISTILKFNMNWISNYLSDEFEKTINEFNIQLYIKIKINEETTKNYMVFGMKLLKSEGELSTYRFLYSPDLINHEEVVVLIDKIINV